MRPATWQSRALCSRRAVVRSPGWLLAYDRGLRTACCHKPCRLGWTLVRLAACHLDRDPTNSELATSRPSMASRRTSTGPCSTCDYPMVTPAYAKQRSSLAKSLGLKNPKVMEAEPETDPELEAAPEPGLEQTVSMPEPAKNEAGQRRWLVRIRLIQKR